MVERRGCLKGLRPWVGVQVELQKLSKISAGQRNISRTRVLSFRLFVPSVLVGRLAQGAAKLAAENGFDRQSRHRRPLQRANTLTRATRAVSGHTAGGNSGGRLPDSS